MTAAVTRGAKTRLSWLLMPFAVQISVLHRPELWWLREQQSCKGVLAATSRLAER
jgi:hypothetical protein